MLLHKFFKKLGTSKLTNSHDFEPRRSAFRIGLVGIAAYLDDFPASIGGSVVDSDGGLAPCAVQGPNTSLGGNSIDIPNLGCELGCQIGTSLGTISVVGHFKL